MTSSITFKPIAALFFIICFLYAGLSAAVINDDILVIYEGSTIVDDTDFGYDEILMAISDDEFKVIEGNVRRIYSIAPEGRSALEIIRNYQSAIQEKNGSIFYHTRNAYYQRIGEQTLWSLFTTGRLNTNNFDHAMFGNAISDYLSAKVSSADAEYHIIVAAGAFNNRTYYELVFIKSDVMDTGMVSLDLLESGISSEGRIAIYDLFFDTGRSEVKEESTVALQIISNFLNSQGSKKFLVVGHTDNIGSFEMNLRLSEERARSVIDRLISDYGIQPEQLIPFGVGPASPVASNSTDEGKARNRRVEIVEL